MWVPQSRSPTWPASSTSMRVPFITPCRMRYPAGMHHDNEHSFMCRSVISGTLAPIRRLLEVQNGLDVVQMIDGELAVVAPLLLGERRHRIGHDAQRLARGIAGEQGLCGPLRA